MGSAEEAEEPEPKFVRLPPSELDRLSDQGLVSYVGRARAAGEREAEKDAVGVLIWGFWPQIQAWVRIKTPTEDVEDVAGEVVASVMRSTFDGKVIGEFAAFVKRIAQRRVADYFIERGRRLRGDRLGSDLGGEDGSWGEEPSSEDATSEVDFMAVVDRVLEGRNETHRKVIRLYGPNPCGFMDLSAAATAAEVNEDDPAAAMTEANVHQIWKRFKNDLENELGPDE